MISFYHDATILSLLHHYLTVLAFSNRPLVTTILNTQLCRVNRLSPELCKLFMLVLFWWFGNGRIYPTYVNVTLLATGEDVDLNEKIHLERLNQTKKETNEN